MSPVPTCSEPSRLADKAWTELKSQDFACKPEIEVWTTVLRIRIRGSMPLTNGSGSCFFFIDLQDANKKQFFFKKLSCLLLFEGTCTMYIIFQRQKLKKKSQNSRNQGFSYYFCLMIEGSGSRSVPPTYGSGSGSRRPQKHPNPQH